MKLQDRATYFISGDACYCLRFQEGMETITDEVEELKSTQNEANMRIVLRCLHSAEDSRVNDIITRSPDTDIFVFVLHSHREWNKACCSILVLGIGDVCDIHLVINETGKDTAPP